VDLGVFLLAVLAVERIARAAIGGTWQPSACTALLALAAVNYDALGWLSAFAETAAVLWYSILSGRIR